MRFETTGEVAPGLHVLGTAEVPVYLLDGAEPTLFDGGLSCLGRTYETAIRRTLGPRVPRRICLTHSHFDHCGSVSYLKRAFAGLEVVGSAGIGEVMARPSAVGRIRMLSAAGTAQARALGAPDVIDEPFEPFGVDRPVADGDEIDLGGGLHLRALGTPGHTRDFTSYYVPERKILVASEAAGCADMTGYIYSEFLVDYDGYVAGLERLAALEVDVLCQGHIYVFTGDDARAHLRGALAAAAAYRARVDELLDAEGGDVDRVVARVRAEEWEPKPEPKQHEAAYMLNVTARVRHLAERRAAGAS